MRQHPPPRKLSIEWESPTVRLRGVSQVYSILVEPESREHGRVSCEIWVDGRLVDSDRSLFEGSSASCLHIT
jgi:hypothetical protein